MHAIELPPRPISLPPLVIRGGPGSGNFGHMGRPGHRGGSASSKGSEAGKIRAGVMAAHFDPSAEPSGELDQRAHKMLNRGLGGALWWEADEDARIRVKDDIVKDLMMRSGLPYDKVNTFVSVWAETSNDSNAQALSIQEAISEEFSVPLSSWQSGKIAGVKGRATLSRGEERAIARAVYDSTQHQLTQAGYGENDTVRLYRGYAASTWLDVTAKGTVPYEGNVVDSWSVGLDVAVSFAESTVSGRKVGYVLAVDVPVRSVFSTAKSGMGCLVEGEFVIFGSVGHETGVVAEY